MIDTLLDLKASKVELVHGVALVNDRAIPFNLAAQDLNADIHYISKTDRYGATIDMRDLRTKMTTEPRGEVEPACGSGSRSRCGGVESL